MRQPLSLSLALAAVVVLPKATLGLQAPDAGAPGAPAQLFSSLEPLRLTLESDFTGILKDRSQDSEYFPAKLTLGEPGSGAQELELQVKTRGNFRLQSRVCGFPPLRLNFPKQAVAGTVFEGQDKIKLTVHCQDKKSEYEQSVLMEYLIYRSSRSRNCPTPTSWCAACIRSWTSSSRSSSSPWAPAWIRPPP